MCKDVRGEFNFVKMKYCVLPDYEIQKRVADLRIIDGKVGGCVELVSSLKSQSHGMCEAAFQKLKHADATLDFLANGDAAVKTKLQNSIRAPCLET